MSNPTLVKAFKAGADIRPNSAVTLRDDGMVVETSSANSLFLGVCELGGKAGDTVDVILSGIANVRAFNTGNTTGLTAISSENGRVRNASGTSLGQSTILTVAGIVIDGANSSTDTVITILIR